MSEPAAITQIRDDRQCAACGLVLETGDICLMLVAYHKPTPSYYKFGSITCLTDFVAHINHAPLDACDHAAQAERI